MVLPLRPLVLCCCLLAGVPAAAAPDAPAAATAAASAPAQGDTVLQLLHDKGLLPDTAVLSARLESNPMVNRVRDAASDLVMSAFNFLGVPYRRGGDSAERGFDCSGFTRYVFEHSVGLVLPRRADQQARDKGMLTVKADELRPGDLVFFNTMRRTFSHVGIYVGDGKFIHAPRSGATVRVEDMRRGYWSKRYNGARRPDLAPGMRLNLPANLPLTEVSTRQP